MNLRKYRWSKVYESAEEELVRLLASKNITAERWSLEDGGALVAQATTVDTRLWCAEGSMVLTIKDKALSLQPGDALDLPEQTVYEVQAGFTGCACYQSPPTRLTA